VSTHKQSLLSGAVSILALIVTANWAAGMAQALTPESPSAPSKAQIVQNYGKIPLSFEANQGQADKSVQFLARGDGYGLSLTAQEAVLALHKPAAGRIRPESAHMTRLGHSPAALASVAPGKRAPSSGGGIESATGITDVVRMQLAGSNALARPAGVEPLSGSANYLIGNDPAQWHTRIPTFAKVRYQSVYPGVDLIYYGNQRQLEYDFVVAPGASAKPIRLHFAGAQELKLDQSGNLVIIAPDGEIAFHKPVVYQIDGKKRQSVEGRFELLADNTAGFALGRYDHSKPLIIDPTLVYATFLGGSDQDYIVAIAVDAAGEAFVTGLTWSQDFPLTPGAFEAVNEASATNGVSTAFVSKFNASGTALEYSTYLGGNAVADTEYLQGDYGHSIAVDSVGEAYLTGWTYSSNFPTTKGAYQTTNKAAANSEATGFVSKLNASGTGLVYSTYLGGSTLDEPVSLALDASGNVYTSGFTFSTDYPTTTGAFQTTNNSASNDGWNTFVSKLNSTGTTLLYSTYLGGSGENGDTMDGIYTILGVAVDKSGDAYVVGWAQSTDYPVTAKTAYQTTNKAATNYGSNITLSELNPAGTALLYSTYLGGSSGSGDFSEGVVVDGSGNAYITGYTYSSDFPVTTGTFQTTNKSAANYESTGFASKLNTAKKGAASLVYSTFLGGSDGDDAYLPAVDNAGDLYISGTTYSSDFPVTTNAFQSTNGYANAFLTELNPAGSKEIYSTYLGGYGKDGGYQVALGSSGGVYIGGFTDSSNFPVTKDAFETTFNSESSTAFVAEFNLGTASTAKSTSTTLTASTNPQMLNKAVTFTAVVAPISGSGTPTGKVTFSVDEKSVSTVTLNGSATATYSTSALAGGAHYVLASYAGNSSYGSSGSGLTETINLPTPVITPATSATYPAVQLVTITDSDKSTVLYYTIDGTTPTTASTHYTAPITVGSAETVQATATSTNNSTSAVASVSYQVIGSPTALAAPATAISTPKATLNAIVNTFGFPGSYVFQYGTSSTALTTSTKAASLSASTSAVTVSAALTTLKAATKYYYQVVVTTAGGTAAGAVLSFTTN
jgi:hypothetical protein